LYIELRLVACHSLGSTEGKKGNQTEK